MGVKMSKRWDPRDYNIEDQLRDIVNGRDVAASGNEVFKDSSNGDVSMYWPSNSEKGHGHAVFHADGSSEIVHY